ncbi:Cof-type HAD-IIB family hydrolase [Alkaliphilus sp. MSJ-5]|uniref:Cof-type HAD-IIB family hydrolase n=1 Tax=Alkaliphilus flagellatus TaxID=2841507 RepID=A0ABS6G663_9FIRM|nr:Cof-type HAD-IIB family hydrolase [Alkaliphilus flagellatus]MBU5677113.1 Cof-type HAD-IIB family hydrolase [Alkaliphilus flagellatus]
MYKPYRIFATDMDGTLLNYRKEISEVNLKAMRDLHKEGIEVVVCTGRSFATVKQYLEQLDFPCWLISNNGSVIRNKSREIVSTTYMKQTVLQKVIRILEKEDVYFHASDEEYYYIKSIYERIKMVRNYVSRVEKSKIKAFWRPIYEVLFSNTHKKVNFNSFIHNGGKITSIFVVSRNSEKINSIKAKLANIEGIDVSSSGKDNIEILDKGATKAHGLAKLLSKLNISSDEIVTVGDNFNDLTMIKYAGLGVAMGNSEAEIKEHADWVTKTNEEDGVAHLIYEKVIKLKEVAME